MDNIGKFLELTSPDGGDTYPGWAHTLYAAMKDLEYGQKRIEKSFEDFKTNWQVQQEGVFLKLHTEEHRKEKGLPLSRRQVNLAVIGILLSVLLSVASIISQLAKP